MPAPRPLPRSRCARPWRARAAMALLGLAWAGAGCAQTESGTAAGDVLRAVVGVHATVPEDARTAASLGTQRAGSGVVIDGSGLVVTIGYLILEASSVEIELADERRVDAAILAYDHDSGFGLLRAREALGVVPIRLGDSRRLERLAHLLVSSHGGVDATRPAVLVGRREFAGYWEYLLEDALFTSPPHPMYGGAALLDERGELVGVGSLMIGDAVRGPRPLPGNMFVPVEALKRVLGDLLATGRSSAPPRPWLGVYSDDRAGPVVVRRLAPDGPAARDGVRVGDILVGVGDAPVTSMAELYRLVWSEGEAGAEVELVVLRGSTVERVTVRSGDRYEWLRLQR